MVAVNATIHKQRRDDMYKDLALARRGDFAAYIRLNGFDASGKRLVVAECHKRLMAHYSSDLTCTNCGASHCQDASRQGPDAELLPVTCPACGQENCAGPRNLHVEGPRGSGKTAFAQLWLAFRLGLDLYHDIRPQALIIGANADEAAIRCVAVAMIMRRKRHTACFGKKATPLAKHPKRNIVFKSKEPALVFAYGILGVPPGMHVDYIWLDDICNQNNTMLKPSMMKKITEKYTNVVAESDLPWSVTNFIGTPWRTGDLNSFLRKFANARPESWRRLTITSGGPDDKPPFWSFWPERFSPRTLEEKYDLDPRAYRRAFMMQEVLDEEIVFKNIHFYVQDSPDRPLTQSQKAVIGRSPILRVKPHETKWPRILALDPGFTGAESNTKNRSKSGICVFGYNLDEWRIYTFYAEEDYWAPRHLKKKVLQLCRQYRVDTLAIEKGGAQIELINWFEDRGLTVLPYNPTLYGSKELRKMPIADAVNSGQVVLRGYTPIHRRDGTQFSELTLMAVPGQSSLYEGLMIFPAELRDIVDAFEIGIRTLFDLHGQRPVVAVELDDDMPLAAHPGLMAERGDAFKPENVERAYTPSADEALLNDAFPAVTTEELAGV